MSEVKGEIANVTAFGRPCYYNIESFIYVWYSVHKYTNPPLVEHSPCKLPYTQLEPFSRNSLKTQDLRMFYVSLMIFYLEHNRRFSIIEIF